MYEARTAAVGLLLATLTAAAGCSDGAAGDSGSSAADTSATDAGMADAQATDATATDATATDSAATDSAATDSAVGDAGAVDTGAADAGSVDSGATDAGTADAGNSDAGGADAGSAVWELPKCSTPTGAPGVAFGPKGGAHYHPSKTAMQPGKSYTMGLAITGKPGVMVAEHASTLYRSTDSGCTWKAFGAAPSTPLRMVATAADRTFAFYDNGDTLVRIDGGKDTVLKAPVANIIGVGVDRSDPDHVRVGGKDGQLWVSKDGGALWLLSGKPAGKKGSTGYRVAFSALNPPRALYGNIGEGLTLTTDGGKTWAKSTFLGAKTPVKINGMNAVFSGVDDKFVWAMAIDIREGLDHPSKTNGKYIWRSTDGGKSFAHAVGHLQAQDVTIRNGVHVVPDSVDTNVVRWAFGTCLSGYGTNLYRYDHGAPAGKRLTWTNHPAPGFVEIAQHPADSQLLVLGVRGDSNPQCP